MRREASRRVSAGARPLRRQPPADERRRRAAADDDDRGDHHARSPSSGASRSARSATMRTSTPSSARTSRIGSGVAQARRARAADAGGRPGRTSSRARARTRARPRTTSSDSIRWNSAPSSAQSRRSARSAAVLLVAEVARRAATQSTSSGAPSRCAERQARRTMRWASGRGRTSASRRSPTAGRRRLAGDAAPAAAALDARDALRPDLLGDLAQRDLAQRDEVLDREEVVERRLDPLLRVDLARRAAARAAPPA